GACGDVNRNVMCCPAPHHNDPVHAQMQAMADRLAAHFAPRTTGYHEIWLTDPATGEETNVTAVGHDSFVPGPSAQSSTHDAGTKESCPTTGNGHASNGHEVEPIYGNAYLPRKFKMGIGLPGDNCVDIYCHDLGLMAVCENY